ncbi:hypothetical protein [Streptomyces cyaneofuscatus]
MPALAVPDAPLVTCDARDRACSIRALIALVRHLIDVATEPS